MKQSAYGYIIDGKLDSFNKEFGIKEQYKSFLDRKGNFIVNLLFSMNVHGKIVEPSYNDVINGFVPLSSRVKTNEEVIKFCRSHKASFARLSSTITIVQAKMKFNSDSGQCVEENIKLFTPYTITMLHNHVDNNGNEVPVLIARANNTFNDYLNVIVKSRITEMYKQSVRYAITYPVVKSREAYIGYRLGLNK